MLDSSLGNLVNAFVRTIAAAGIVAAAGCALSPDQRMVGIYSPDPARSEIPMRDVPGIDRVIREATRNVKLKLLSDHRFVLTGVRAFEGSWSTEGDLLYLRPDANQRPHLLFLGADQAPLEEVRIRIGGNRALQWDQATTYGMLKVRLRKTG
jgi:hypothetical protein